MRQSSALPVGAQGPADGAARIARHCRLTSFNPSPRGARLGRAPQPALHARLQEEAGLLGSWSSSGCTVHGTAALSALRTSPWAATVQCTAGTRRRPPLAPCLALPMLPAGWKRGPGPPTAPVSPTRPCPAVNTCSENLVPRQPTRGAALPLRPRTHNTTARSAQPAWCRHACTACGGERALLGWHAGGRRWGDHAGPGVGAHCTTSQCRMSCVIAGKHLAHRPGGVELATEGHTTSLQHS